jgi:hypothetical protein
MGDFAKFRSQNVLQSKALQIFVNRNHDCATLPLTELLPSANVTCVITRCLPSGQNNNNLGGSYEPAAEIYARILFGGDFSRIRLRPATCSAKSAKNY